MIRKAIQFVLLAVVVLVDYLLSRLGLCRSCGEHHEQCGEYQRCSYCGEPNPTFGNASSEWHEIFDYMRGNYPQARGETLPERVEDALEEMDEELGQYSYSLEKEREKRS